MLSLHTSVTKAATYLQTLKVGCGRMFHITAAVIETVHRGSALTHWLIITCLTWREDNEIERIAQFQDLESEHSVLRFRDNRPFL